MEERIGHPPGMGNGKSEVLLELSPCLFERLTIWPFHTVRVGKAGFGFLAVGHFASWHLKKTIVRVQSRESSFLGCQILEPSLRSSPVTPPRFRSLGQPEARFADGKVVIQ
jgi:hypothetical protein